MRSNLFITGLTIALGLATPIALTTAFPEMTVAQTVDQRKLEADRLYEKGQQQPMPKGAEAALQLFTQASDLYRGISDFVGESNALSSIGFIYSQQQNYSKAVENYQKALAALRRGVDRRGEDGIMNDMAIAYRRLGNYSKALEAHQQALVLRRKNADRRGEGATTRRLK
jgi:tetratricopeptide (TPR) repeat protein